MQIKIITLAFISLLVGGICNAQISMGESGSGFLTSLPPDTPVLCLPADKTIELRDTVCLSWHPQIHAATYTLQISDSIDFSALLSNQTALADTQFYATNLENNTTYFWRVSASNVAGECLFSEIWSFTTSFASAVDPIIKGIYNQFALLPAYPNPFNPKTTLTYHLPEKAEVSIVIYNNMGQPIQELVSGYQHAGVYKISWDGCDPSGLPVKSGLYICLLFTDSRVLTQKLVLMQ